jgi:hypothetical protein
MATATAEMPYFYSILFLYVFMTFFLFLNKIITVIWHFHAIFLLLTLY